MTDVTVTINAPIPKKYREARNAGNKAINTPYIFLETESPPCICGAGDITNFSI